MNINFIFNKSCLYVTRGGLAAAFDLAAYAGYMIARAKKSVNHSLNHTEHAREKFFISVSAPYWIWRTMQGVENV